jgi:O-antigen/teichoic acid export membrane protein
MGGSMAGKILIGFVQVAVLSRHLEPKAYGELSIAMAVTMFVTSLLSFRIWEFVTRFLADALARRDAAAAAATVRLAYLIAGAVGIVTFVAVLASAPLVSRYLMKGHAGISPVVIFATTSIICSPNDTSAAALRVLGRFRLLSGLNLAASMLRLAFVIVPVMLGAGLIGVLVAMVMAEAVSASLQGLSAAAALRGEFGLRVGVGRVRDLSSRRDEIKQILAFSFGIDTLRAFGTQADLLLLGYVRGPAEVGVYRAALNIVDAVNRVLGLLSSVAQPTLAKLAAQGQKAAFMGVLRRSTIVGLAAALLASLVITVAAPVVIEAANGAGFEGAVKVLRILVWSTIWISTFWAVPALMSCGLPHVAFRLILAWLVVKLTALLILSTSFGTAGVAVASVVTSIGYMALAAASRSRIRRALDA